MFHLNRRADRHHSKQKDFPQAKSLPAPVTLLFLWFLRLRSNKKLSVRKLKAKTTFICSAKTLSRHQRSQRVPSRLQQPQETQLKTMYPKHHYALLLLEAATTWTWTHPRPPAFGFTGELHAQKTISFYAAERRFVIALQSSEKCWGNAARSNETW